MDFFMFYILGPIALLTVVVCFPLYIREILRNGKAQS